MKKFFFLVATFFLTTQSFATIITVFSSDYSQCQYVISDDNGKSVASWKGDCLEKFTDTKSIHITKESYLWKELKKLNPALDLQNIQLIFTRDKSTIAKLKAIPVPVINVDKQSLANSFRINSDAYKTIEKQEAQDYNSSRSNKANSISNAQDYNSSRSNKANSISTVKNSDSSDNDKNAIATAQDYNSSRNNKANSISTAQDYNSSRSNKANSISTVKNSDSSDNNKKNPISTAQDYNSSRSNKANSISTVKNSDTTDNSKKNAVATAQDYNSSRSNKANSISTAQDYNSSRSNKAGIILSAGTTVLNKNIFMKNGFAVHAGYHIPVKNSFGIEAGIEFLSNKFSYNTPSSFSKEYKNETQKSIADHKWRDVTLSIGPSIRIGNEKYNATIYTNAVAIFTKIPQQKIGGEYHVASFGGNHTSFGLNPGMRLNYSINHRISLSVNPEYLTSLKKNISYEEKDISKAINASGNFDPDTYSSLPMNKKLMGINLFGINAGMEINL